MGLKKLVVDALALGPTSRGFTGGEARRWVRESYRHRTRDYGFSKKDTRWALRHGFLPEQAARLGITAENVGDYISAKAYAFLRPLNGTYSTRFFSRSAVICRHSTIKSASATMKRC